MTKRNLASVLWFLAGWSGGGLLAGYMGLPSILAFVPGILVAGLVRWDPAGLFWSRSATARRIRPINEFAAELDKRVDHGIDKRIEQWPAAEADTRRV